VIGLATVSGPTGDERGCGELALDPPPIESSLEHVAGPGGLVAGADVAVVLETLEPPAELAVIIGQAVQPQGLGILVLEDGGGDGILVDIEPHPEDGGGSGGRDGWSPVGCGHRPHVALVNLRNGTLIHDSRGGPAPSIVFIRHVPFGQS
jgi:hypothetical protein